MSFGNQLNFPYSQGVTSTALVPAVYDCAIAGRPYMIDTNVDPSMRNHSSIAYLTKFLTSPVFGSPATLGQVGEASLNPDINWRRGATAWDHGAGQAHLDLAASDHNRFNASKGIDPWTVGKIGLLHDTSSARASANTNLQLVNAGTYMYLSDGAALKYSTNLSAWSDAGIGATISSIASNGFSVWAALAAGIFVTTRGSGSSASTSDLVASLIGYTKGRLMAAQGPNIYNITWARLAIPTGLAVVATGTTGATTYGYRVSALNAGGETLACTHVTIANGNAALTGTNYNQLNWTAVTGATSYKVYGRTSGSELLMTSVSTNSYKDDGTIVTPAGAVPAADTSGAAPAALFTHDNTDWTWVGFCAGDTCIYAAGYSGDYSAVYRIPIKSDGTGLGAAVQAGELPRGETALSISYYLAKVFVGTTVGIRLALEGSSGELTIGSALPVGPVRCAIGLGRFVWFGWENYDTTTTGLGRLDITVINTDAPAYATDLQAAAQGTVPSVALFNGLPVFTVSGVGVFQQSANLVPSGVITSGQITYDLTDPKVAQAVQVRYSLPLVGSLNVALAVDEGTYTSLGTQSASTPQTAFSCNATKAHIFELQLTLTRSGTDATSGPTVSRFTLTANPAALSGEQIFVPVLIRHEEHPAVGVPRIRDCADDVAFLQNLRRTKQTFVYQEGNVNYSAIMSDYTFYPNQLVPDRSCYEGTFVCQLLSQDTQ